MGFGAIRGIFRPLSRTLISRTSTSTSTPSTTSFLLSPNLHLNRSLSLHPQSSPWRHHFSIFAESSLNRFDRLTDTRYPKRRPLYKPRPKRPSLRAAGPYAWVKHVPGQPILPSNPNQGSVKRRNEKKRIKLRRVFIKAEAKKRKAQLQEAKRKKMIKRVEHKMAAVAREREWAQRLAELQQLEEEKKKSLA